MLIYHINHYKKFSYIKKKTYLTPPCIPYTVHDINRHLTKLVVLYKDRFVLYGCLCTGCLLINEHFGLGTPPTPSILEYQVLCILITRFQFSSHRNLWSTTAFSKYVPAFRLGQLSGMPRCRFDEIWTCLTPIR